MNAHLIWTSRQWVELGFEFGKSGIKADVLGYGSRLPSGRKDARLHPAPRHGARLSVGAQWTVRVEAVLRAGWLWGVIGAPGLRTRLSSVTIVPAVIFTTSPCISDLGGLTLCPGPGLALQRLWLKQENQLFLCIWSQRLGPSVTRLQPRVPCKPSGRVENWGQALLASGSHRAAC